MLQRPPSGWPWCRTPPSRCHWRWTRPIRPRPMAWSRMLKLSSSDRAVVVAGGGVFAIGAEDVEFAFGADKSSLKFRGSWTGSIATSTSRGSSLQPRLRRGIDLLSIVVDGLRPFRCLRNSADLAAGNLCPTVPALLYAHPRMGAIVVDRMMNYGICPLQGEGPVRRLD